MNKIVPCKNCKDMIIKCDTREHCKHKGYIHYLSFCHFCENEKTEAEPKEED